MSSPLRILHIIPSISLVYGGPSQMVLGFSEALARAGADVTILTTNANGDAGQPPLDVPLNQPVAQNGYQIRYFHCSPFRRYKFSIPLLRWLAQHGSEFDIAHIHALFSPVSSLAATIARSQDLPYLLRPLGTLDPADLQKKRLLKQLYALLLEKPNLAGAAAIHFTAEQEARVSERFGAVTKDIVLPLGVMPPNPVVDIAPLLAAWGIPADETVPLLLFMSRLDPKKGLELLVPALEQLLAEGHRFHFVLAGSNSQDPEYEQHIQHRLRTSPLEAVTTLAGFVTDEKKAALLQRADVFVLPSYYENFGIAVAEAMAAGVPVLISNQVYIWQDVQQAEAGWVTDCTVESLTNTLRIAFSNPADRQQRGINAQAYALKHYSWESIAQRAIQIYHQCLGANS